MEQTECSEKMAHKIQMPGNCLEESIQHSEHGESFKYFTACKVCISRSMLVCFIIQGNSTRLVQ